MVVNWEIVSISVTIFLTAFGWAWYSRHERDRAKREQRFIQKSEKFAEISHALERASNYAAVFERVMAYKPPKRLGEKQAAELGTLVMSLPDSFVTEFLDLEEIEEKELPQFKHRMALHALMEIRREGERIRRLGIALEFVGIDRRATDAVNDVATTISSRVTLVSLAPILDQHGIAGLVSLTETTAWTKEVAAKIGDAMNLMRQDLNQTL